MRPPRCPAGRTVSMPGERQRYGEEISPTKHRYRRGGHFPVVGSTRLQRARPVEWYA
jgi:hypothetical protein